MSPFALKKKKKKMMLVVCATYAPKKIANAISSGLRALSPVKRLAKSMSWS